MRRLTRMPFLALALCAATPAFALQPLEPAAELLAPRLDTLSFTQLDRAEALGRDHLNELWRVRALRELKLEDSREALEDFRRAARYADKFSQHSLSLMYWHGVGTEADRALAYVWADLAAERGYRDLLLVREKMWMEMDADDRARALEIGPALYADYGDEVAQPRMEQWLRRARADITGSRLGASADRVKLEYPSGRVGVRGRDLFDSDRWDPDDYWQAEDRQWRGKVIVLPAEKVGTGADEGQDDD